MPYKEVDGDANTALVALLQEWDDVDPRRRFRAWSTVAAEVGRRGSALELFHERHALTLDGTTESEGALRQAAASLARWRAGGFEVITVLDDAYPLLLRQIDQVSPLLFTTGGLRTNEVGVALVGSRTASIRGQEFAADVARALAQRKIAVVSGLANGIDAVAHRATLAARGRAIGVLGTGVGRIHPTNNRALHEQVAAVGVLVSPFLPDCPPDRHTLALRNVTMAGMARASVVVEAGERSGSRVHARYALTLGRPLILTAEVVRSKQWGREFSGRTGVHVAENVVDVLDVIDRVVCGVDAGA